MALPQGYEPIKGTNHTHPSTHRQLQRSDAAQQITVTLMLRRQRSDSKVRELQDFKAHQLLQHAHADRSAIEAAHGADPAELKQVEAFARQYGLSILESSQTRRSIVVRGSVSAMNDAFAVDLYDFQSPRGRYHGHANEASLPSDIKEFVEAVVGLDNRQVPATHYATPARQGSDDPVNTKPVTPQQIASLYDFPAGDGAGQTIGIYEMATGDGPAGYSVQDLTQTMRAFGGHLATPQPIDVSVDGVTNSGKSDGETGLDITIASAIAPAAKLAVYFTGGEVQNILHAVQRMVHPDPGDPVPTVISISYGWGPDDASAHSFSDTEYAQLGSLFQDAANLSITVLVSSGDSGAFIESKTQAQTSYPATEPWVIACGGTTVGNITDAGFDEYVWNDIGAGGPGATGGGVSPMFPIPSYQQTANVPVNHSTHKLGRGIPDIAGNASENSGYPQYINGQEQPVGGTSAVAPLYAGLIARINANINASVGFINPTIYAAPAAAKFREVAAPPGPANNSCGGVTGYPAVAGWNACTGLGSVNGTALQAVLKAALASGSSQQASAAA